MDCLVFGCDHQRIGLWRHAHSHQEWPGARVAETEKGDSGPTRSTNSTSGRARQGVQGERGSGEGAPDMAGPIPDAEGPSRVHDGHALWTQAPSAHLVRVVGRTTPQQSSQLRARGFDEAAREHLRTSTKTS